MSVQSIPKVTHKQTEILDLIYTHRFLTRIQIQTILKHKDKKTINLWLKDLRQKEYINWIYNKHHFAEKTKPAIYYMGINGIRHLHNMGFHEDKEINKRYREHKRSQGFIDRCLAIANVCISLDAARTVDNEDTYPEPGISYFYETEADYRSDSYYHFLSDNELIQPNLCFNKAIHEGHEEPKVVNSYLLEIFDATLPRYRLRNRLKKYVEYLDEEMDEWDEQTYGDPKPAILLVCATLTDLIYAKRRTKGLMADIWEYEDEDRPGIRFITIDKLKEHGIPAEIWEEA
ncbi:replication-relaxation family protein [Candidatus Saccharibacteria bacterium]|nr:replication-relaxation family protein [Candidatus Saccharibacteria bacterium]